MDFDEALVIVYTYAVAGRQELEEELVVRHPEAKPMPDEKVSEAFQMVESRVNKAMSKRPKKRK